MRNVNRKKGRDRDLGWEEQYQDVGKSVQRLKEHWLGFAQYFSFRYILKNFEIIFSDAQSPSYSVLQGEERNVHDL